MEYWIRSGVSGVKGDEQSEVRRLLLVCTREVCESSFDVMVEQDLQRVSAYAV